MFDHKRLIAAIYVRVSTEEQAQEGQSIQAQIEVLTQYCKLFNIQIYDVYKDPGVSGKSMNRPGLEKLIHDSKLGLFNTVLVWKISRLSRSLKDLLIMLDKFEQKGVSFISYSEKFDTSTPVGRMTLQILGSIAEFERNTIVENVKLGLGELARKGRKASAPLLGYDYVDKELVINSSEADTIRLIFDMYANSKLGIAGVVKWLNENGYRTKRGNPFGKDTLGDILSNPAYISKNRHQVGTEKEHVVDGIHESIIDMDTWELAQKKREKFKDTSKRRHEAGISLLAGYLKCPDCGCCMTIAYHRKKRPNKNGQIIMYRYRYYECGKFARTRECNNNRMNAEKIEEEVIHRIKNVSKNPKILELAIEESKRQLKQEAKPIMEEINSLKKQVDKSLKAKEKYMELFAAGKGKLKNIDQIVSKINEYDNEIDMLNLKMSEYNYTLELSSSNIDIERMEGILHNFAAIIDIATPEDKKELIQSIVKEIKINKNKQLEYVAVGFDLGNCVYRI